MERISNCENYIRKLLERMGVAFISEQVYRNNRRSDFVVSKNNREYYIEIKHDLNFQTYLNMFEKDDFSNDNNRKNIFIVFNSVSDKARGRANENSVEIIDIANLLYIVQNDEKLLNELISLLKFSIDNIEPQKSNVEIFRKLRKPSREQNDEINKENYINELIRLEKGKNAYQKYEKLMVKILRKIFNNELKLFDEQVETDESLNRFDMICKIKNNVSDEFFQTIEQFYNTKYILFEFKNYTEPISQREVCTTEKYLYNTALRNVAIICSRDGIDENGLKMTKGILRENGKLMIILDDKDIIKMINKYNKNEKASTVIMEKLDELLIKLEK